MLFSEKLDLWYDEFGRTLPWRGIGDPYRIWLSEIILQQTRIEQGRDYYLRFVEAYPTIADLAAASDEAVMRLWQGLGYYSRCRNLLAAARYVVQELGGRFPDTYEGILRLKGVGRYTAAAIASFAYRLPHPVIDGNVYRFISRLFGIATPVNTPAAYDEFEQVLLRLIDRRRPDRFNAALMDFGSLQCRQQGPDCAGCPFAAECVALAQGRVGLLPVRLPKARPTERFFYYLHLTWSEDGTSCTLVRQRGAGDIWQGLFEFPLVELPAEAEGGELRQAVGDFLSRQFGIKSPAYTATVPMRHQLTHRTIVARFLRAELASKPPVVPPEYRVARGGEIKNVPVSRLIDKYLQRL